jgi:hypothetical protein
MMRPRFGVVLLPCLAASLLVTAVLTAPASATVFATSTFDSGTEGWTAVTIDTAGNVFPSSVSFAAGAGNSTGALRHVAPSESRTSYFAAPGHIVEALRAAVGGFISWDIATINAPADLFFSDVDIEIRAGGSRIRRNVTPPAPAIFPAYGRYTLGFATSAGWLFVEGTTIAPATQAQIDAVLSAADTLLIRAEYWSSATPDTTLLDNVVVAGAGPAVILNRTVAVPGDPVELRLVGNSALGPVDLYVVAALPPAVAPGLGCGNSLALIFVTNGGTALTLACSANPPSTFPRYTGNSTLPASATLLTTVWPAEAPPGPYIFAAVVTPPAALADGAINPGDLLAVAGVLLTGGP